MTTTSIARTAAAALLLGLLSPAITAQIRGLPQKSPRASVAQVVGVTELAVDYHRPAVLGRKVWGDLVPYGAVWRAGANENTVFKTSDPIRIGDTELPAGSYGLHIIPEAKTWIIIFSHDNDKWGSFSYDPARDAVRVNAKPRAVARRESLAYGFSDVTFEGAQLILGWDEFEIAVPIEVDTPKIVLTRIEKQLAQDSSPTTLLSAASFALQFQVGLDDAIYWCEDALAAEETANGIAIRAAILAALGRDEEADEGVAIALELLSNVNDIATTGAQLQNLGSHAIALHFLLRAAELAPSSSRVWNLVATSQRALDQNDEALASFRKALQSVQGDSQRGVIERAIKDLEAPAPAAR